MPRVWLKPPSSRTIHFLGDTHIGGAGGSITAAQRLDNKVIPDLANGLVPTPAARVQVGDVTEDGTTAQVTTSLTYLTSLGITSVASGPAIIAGNHDIRTNPAIATFLTAYGITAKNRAIDLGGTLPILLLINPDAKQADDTTILLASDTLAWLDAQLAAATKDCIIVCHAPLYNTVLDDTLGVDPQYLSTDSGFYVTPNDGSIEAILNARPRAKMWVSGHTHSTISASNLVKVHSVGTRNIIALNASSTYYIGKVIEPALDPIQSPYVTWNTDGTVTVSWRDHGGGVWLGSKRQTLTIPA